MVYFEYVAGLNLYESSALKNVSCFTLNLFSKSRFNQVKPLHMLYFWVLDESLELAFGRTRIIWPFF